MSGSGKPKIANQFLTAVDRKSPQIGAAQETCGFGDLVKAQQPDYASREATPQVFGDPVADQLFNTLTEAAGEEVKREIGKGEADFCAPRKAALTFESLSEH